MTCETVDFIHLGLGSVQGLVLAKTPMGFTNTLINTGYTLMSPVNTLIL